MNEISPEKTLLDYVAIVRRRWRIGAAALFATLLPALVTAYLWPATYRSTATILIEQQEIPQDLVRTTITSFADQRIELISQRVMTTTNLLSIIRTHDLYSEDFDSEPREVIIDRMRGDISRDMISAEVVDPRSGRPTSATIAFTVGFDSRSPQQAVRVANELTSLYLQENSQTRREQAAEASSFLADEAGRLSAEIENLEARLAAFKQENVNKLPELAQLNMQLFQRTEAEISDAQRQRSLLEERKIYLESELAQLNPTRDYVGEDGAVILPPRERLNALRAQLASLVGVYSSRHPLVLRTQRAIEALEEELGISVEATRQGLVAERARIEGTRAQLLTRYSDLHPDVQRVERQLEQLDGELRAIEPAESPLVDADADNPVYVQIKTQLLATEADLSSLDDKERELQARLNDFEERLTQTPMIERDYYALTRDLESARERYQQIRFSGRSAQTAENLEIDAKGERFTLIEPALLPQRPIAPNRPVIVFLGALLSVGLAVAAVALVELFDSSVHSPGEYQALTRLVPIGIIPAIVTLDDRRRRRTFRLLMAAGATGAIVLAVALMHFFVMPVDDFWFRAIRRLGV